jgi:serine/threonine protein kinase/tetratricopeptide (TPR) repeat protein
MTVVGEALELTDPAERAAYLDHACGGDAGLRARVEALLAAHAGAGRFLDPDRSSALDTTSPGPSDATRTLTPDAPRPGPLATGDYRPDDPTGTIDHADPDATSGSDAPAPRSAPADRDGLGAVVAGRYTLVAAIGEGGMGSVYLASQTEPVKRQVALKLIKSGMDSKAVLARFEAERQALALMDHPNIARIYDGGVTEKGQPFFVMELVRGVPLTDYCDQKRLSVESRLELFVQACQAVQHAHQKGIIHRDLKPGNVLVTEVDGRPTPEVIDFGVAKATEQELTNLSFADTGVIVGTPAYMSPEQADPTSMDIDTRTDVYALGVILYELLTGSPPLEARQFKRGAILEMLRMVREVEPPRPSTKLSAADDLPGIATNRDTEPAKLMKLLRGELDWVVMKAIEKDRTRRYETANGLARDIQRYLADEVVEARPPSPGYRLKKFLRRNKGPVIAVGLVLLAMVGGVVGTCIGLVQAERARTAEADRITEERRRAEAEQQAQELQAREEAQRRVAQFRRKSDEARFLGVSNTPVAAASSPAGESGPGALYSDPGAARAALRAALSLAESWGPAVDSLVLESERPRVAREVYDLLLVAAALEPPNEGGGREALALLDRTPLLRVTPTRGYYRLRADALARTGDLAAAKSEREKAEAAGTPESALDYFLAGERLRNPTDLLLHDDETRREMLENALGRYRAALAAEPGYFWAQYQLGRCFLALGRNSEAAEALGACVALRPESPWSYVSRGFALALQDRYAEAIADLDRALRLDPGCQPARLNRGWIYLAQKQYDKALADFDAVLAPPEDRQVITATSYYRALVRLGQGLPKEALKELQAVVFDEQMRPFAHLRARLRLEDGDVPGALEDLSTFVGVGKDLAKDAAEACERRGRQLLTLSYVLTAPAKRMGLRAAAAEFERAEARGGNSAELYRRHGAVLELLGQVGKAAESYSRGLDREPDHVRLLVLRGWARGRLEQYDQALDDFARAVANAPADAEAHTGLGYLQARRKDVSAARREATLALVHGGSSYLILHNVACIYAEMARQDRVGAKDHENATLDLLRQAVALWRKGGKGPDEVQLIREEPAFSDLLGARPEFQDLLAVPPAAAVPKGR